MNNEGVIEMPADMVVELREMRKEQKEANQNVLTLSGELKTFMKTEALERKIMQTQIDQNTKDIVEIKADKKFVRQQFLSEIIKYGMVLLGLIIALTKVF